MQFLQTNLQNEKGLTTVFFKVEKKNHRKLEIKLKLN